MKRYAFFKLKKVQLQKVPNLMAKPSMVKILEEANVSPVSPPNSSPSAPSTIPLTFFDLPWLFFSPSQPLFFYQYHFPTSHFISFTLPNLKHSFSLTLQLLPPFASNLVLPPESNYKPYIAYTDGDSVSFTVAEYSNADHFNHLTRNYPRDVAEFHSLVPQLTSKVAAGASIHEVLPLLAVQVTIFPNVGLSLGFAYHHVVADGRTFNNFVKTWASFCKDLSFSIKPLAPLFDRTVITDSYGLEDIFFNEWRKRKCSEDIISDLIDLSGLARATFVVGSNDMENIKSWIIAQCNNNNMPQPVHLSPYVITCSFVWVCLVKLAKAQECTQSEKYLGDDPIYFGFNAGGITRLNYPVPTSYFGNCIGFGRSMSTRRELLGEDGIIVAANAIGNTIKKLDKAMLEGADKWISDWEVLLGSDIHVLVSGSPKLDLYKTDFGWGRPTKIEEISIDKMRAISLTESSDFEGGIEVGLALPKVQIDAFTFLFNQGLKLLQ